MFTHYGCVTDRWFPTNSHGPLTSADLMQTNLAVLEPYRGKLLIPRGIRAMNQWSTDLAYGQGNDPHTQVVGSYFTCHPVTPNTDNPFDISNAEAKLLAMPISRSLDHVCAEQLNPDQRPLLMRVSGVPDNAQSQVSYSAAETPYDGLGDPALVVSQLTGLFVGGDMSPDSYRVLRGKSVLDVVRADLEALERHDMSAADAQKLAAWKELLDSTTGSVLSQCNPEVADMLGATAANAALFADVEGDRLTAMIGANLDFADLFSNLAVLAALCDRSRVILLKYPGSYRFSGLDLDIESHSLSHRLTSPAGLCQVQALEYLETIDRYYASKFAHLVSTLDSFDEGAGTLLDNTAAVWFQELSDGNAHNLNNMPLIQAGSCGGYFKTGQAINVDGGDPALHRGNSSAMCNTNQVLDTGTPPEFANAPINKYYCSLMNALGVRAGSDGFPLSGGTEEVTHFGMYDRTEDFSGGGSKPALISDPGAFDALKA